MPTYSPKKSEISHAWHLIDASDVVLGRLATHAATLLRGKHKPIYAPHMDTGDYVVIINADKIALTGNKLQNKKIFHHSGFPGGIKSKTVAQVLEAHPERVVEKAIQGMIPHGKLGKQVASKLKVYAGPEHPHASQNPVPYEIKKAAQ